MKAGGSVLFIPAVNGDMNSYNSFLDIENIKFNSLSSNEKKITAINFDHPIFKEAFERKDLATGRRSERLHHQGLG